MNIQRIKIWMRGLIRWLSYRNKEPRTYKRRVPSNDDDK